MPENPAYLASSAALLLIVPACALAALALLSGAPGEWGRGALTAYTAVAVALIAGASLGPWALALGLLAVLSLIVGGPWGALLSGLAAAGAALLTVFVAGASASIHPVLCPSLAVLALAGGLRGLI